MSCNTCPPPAACDTSLLCEPVHIPDDCCCPPRPILAAPVCNVKVCEVLNCETDNRSAFFIPNNPDGRGLACACVCLDDDLALTATQKAAVVKLLDGVMRAIVPYEYCCDTKDFRQRGGHTFPLKPPTIPHQPSGLNGAMVPVTTINPALPVVYYADPASECCADNLHSPFMRGDNVTYDVGMGRPHFFTDRDMLGSSGLGFAKIAETICCAKDAVLASA